MSKTKKQDKLKQSGSSSGPAISEPLSFTHDGGSNIQYRVFGISLERYIESHKGSLNGSLVPAVIEKSLQYLNNKESLETEGIFRISADQGVLFSLKRRFDRGEDIDLTTYDTHTVASVVKSYFRELPEPLLTFDLYDCFVASMGISEAETRKQRLKKLLEELPKAHYVLFKKLAIFLWKVSKYADKNRMSTTNLGVVFGPNLCRVITESMETMVDAGQIAKLITLFIEECSFFFESPPEEETKPAATAATAVTTPIPPPSITNSRDKNSVRMSMSGEQKLFALREAADYALAEIFDELKKIQNELMKTNNLEQAIPVARKIRYFKKVLQGGVEPTENVESQPSTNKANSK